MVAKFSIDRLHQVAKPKKLLNSDAVNGDLASFSALSFCSVIDIPFSEKFNP